MKLQPHEMLSDRTNERTTPLWWRLCFEATRLLRQLGLTAIWLPYSVLDIREGGSGDDFTNELATLIAIYAAGEVLLAILVRPHLLPLPFDFATVMIRWWIADAVWYMLMGSIVRLSLRRWDFLK